MEQQHHERLVRTYTKGANTDTEEQFVGSGEGFYYEAINMRPGSIGDSYSMVKIKGERLYEETDPINGIWKCIGASVVSDRKVAFWVDRSKTSNPCITVDGIVVCQTGQLPYSETTSLETRVNNNSNGGEIFVNDRTSSILIFDIEDMIEKKNQGSNLYFSAFNILQYSLNLSKSLNKPVFVELVNKGGGGGVNTGTHKYSFAYKNSAGDYTTWSEFTPLIIVPSNYNTGQKLNNIYPYIENYGSDSSEVKSSYGVKIKFRVDNTDGVFSTVVIKRVSYSQAEAIDFVGKEYVIKEFEVSQGITVYEFTDSDSDSDTPTVLTTEESVATLAAIKSAKAIKYYNNRLFLGNIEYESKDIEDSIEFIKNGSVTDAYPFVRDIGSKGYKDAYTSTYYRRFMSGETYGFAIKVFDSKGNESFTKDIPGFENYTFPNRRDEIPLLERGYSDVVNAASVNGSYERVYEVFSNEDSVSKDNQNQGRDILTVGTGSSYKPYHPVSYGDTDKGGHDFKYNPSVFDGSTEYDYEPKGFSNKFFTTGLRIGGVSSLPSFAQAFSVVMTRPANRVICQGLAMYSLNPAEPSSPISFKQRVSKDLNKFWFFSPDIESGYVSETIIQDMKANPNNYKVQLVSPLGFFSEVMNGEIETANNRDRLVDMITYANILFENGDINPGDGISNVGIDGSVAYGKYRNSQYSTGNFKDNNNGNKLFSLVSINDVQEDRSSYFKIELSENIYQHQYTGGGDEFSQIRNWHEPFYIVNIVQIGASVSDSNIKEYIDTGTYIKTNSLIGVSSGNSFQEFDIVDERIVDCCVSAEEGDSVDKYIYVEIDGEFYRYINITRKNNTQINAIYQDIRNENSDIRGVFTNSLDYKKIILSNQEFVTPEGAYVYVRYDNRFPIEVFGDSFVGETIFCPIDRHTNEDSDVENQFLMQAGFPYYKWDIDSSVLIVKRTKGIDRKATGASKLKLGYIRQMAMMFICESRINLAYTHGDKFPDIGYVQRPNRWDDGDSMEDNNIFQGYIDNFPNEKNIWRNGGFRFSNRYNLDYSKKPIDKISFSKPKVGYKEKTIFPTRVVWSEKRPTNIIASPGLKTIPDINYFDIPDEKGEITYIESIDTRENGSNLYAFTSFGIAMLQTDKRTIYQKTGQELSTSGGDDITAITDYIWRSENGCPVELVDTVVKEENKIYFANKKTFYIFDGFKSEDISNFYKNRITKEIEKVSLSSQIEVSSVYNFFNKEYWASFKLSPLTVTSEGNNQNIVIDERFSYYSVSTSELEFFLTLDIKIIGDVTIFITNNSNTNLIIRTVPNYTELSSITSGETFVFKKRGGEWSFEQVYYSDIYSPVVIVFEDSKIKNWIGFFTYEFDRFVNVNNEVFGFKDLKTYILGKDFYVINSSLLTAKLVDYTSQRNDSEFVEISLNSNKEPSSVEFSIDKDKIYSTPDSIVNGVDFKNYTRYEQYVPRKTSPPHDRMQGMYLVYTVIEQSEDDFKIVDSSIQLKKLR